jgi:predicted Zn-dependent peptidase
MMKKMSLMISLALIFSACCCNKNEHKTISKTDANGYAYEEVTNDPYKARIYTLKNGLKVYLTKNNDEPRVQTVIAVKAGSKDEPRDNTGLAHYLEHMMFKGTDHFGTIDWEKERLLLDSITNLFEQHKQAATPEAKKAIYKQIDAVSNEAAKYAISNEYDKIVGTLGASGTNAFTSYDQTAYVNEIPSNEIERFIKLEYDRFTNMQLRLFHTELETVYEEFNMYQDDGNSMMQNKLFEGLFAEHPYKTDVIGIPEQLKNPSMKSVMEFQKKFYVPNNMAILMAGDLDFEKTIQIVDKYFGQMQPNDNLDRPAKVEEQPITACQTFHVTTPDEESIAVGYRSGDPKSKEALYLNLIGEIFYNGKAGLIDLDLIQKQKVLEMYAGMEQLKDYGVFLFQGKPREGQSLEEVGKLIQEEIAKLKAGDFDEELLKAIINNKKLEVIQLTDGRYSCFSFLGAFIYELDWKDYISEIDEMAKLTKKEIVAFANEFFKDNNYVTVYKHTGENKDKVEVEKPHITPVGINRDSVSAFAQALYDMKSEPVQPVFVNFEEKIKREPLSGGVDFYYTENTTNKIYQLNQFVEISKYTDKKLALAFNYLPYLGTSKYTPEQLKMEMYKLAMSFNATATGGKRSYVTLYGLNETMPQSLSLMEEMMSDAVVNQEAYNNMVQDILKERANNKLNKGIILGGLMAYAQYGAKSSFTDKLSEDELKAINPQELIDLIKSFSSYQHGFFYYGPDSKKEVMKILKKLKTPETWKPVPPPVEYAELPMDKPTVYFADYDMVQAEFVLLAKDKVFDPALMPLQTMFNSYYGSGMHSIVFQEVRESRGLAYSAYTFVNNPYRKGLSDYIIGYIGTQSDKMATAMDLMKELLTNMPKSEQAFTMSKEYVLNNLRSSRLTKSSIFWSYMHQKDMGIDSPFEINKAIFEQTEKITLADIQNFFDSHIKPAQYSIVIVGKRNKIDFNYLKKVGEVKEIGLTELVGY